MEVIKIGALLILVLIISVLFGAFFTGHAKRAYHIIDLDEIVIIKGDEFDVKQLAERYVPNVFIQKNYETPPLLWVWYEVIEVEKSYDIQYYFVWENEIHPNAILHNLYSFFRGIYYGIPLYDVEYWQVSVDKETGDINKMRFETSPGDDYNVTISKHWISEYYRQNDGFYENVVIDKDDNVEISRNCCQEIKFKSTHPEIISQTWNHLTRLLTPEDGDDLHEFVDINLKELTEQDYQRHKFVRKSQGDHFTSESGLSLIFGTLASFLLLGVPALIFIRGRREKM
jgi:hypothetical protein